VEGWNRRISTCSRCERQKQFAGGAGGFVVLFRGSSTVVMITVVAMIMVITTAVFAWAMSLVGVMSMIRVARAGNAVMPGA
jgi:hypothetical protein